MARILYLGDAGCTTGFGRVTHAIGDRLVTDYGHDISVIAVNYDGDHWPTPLKLYRPNLMNVNDVYGQSRFVEMLAEVMPDLVFILNDPYIVMKFLLRNRWDKDFALARTAPIVAYLPVDGTNFPTTWPKLPETISKLPPVKGGLGGPKFVPVVMSKHGRTAFPDAELIYHGVDTKLFRPPSIGNPWTTSGGRVIHSKADAKAALSLSADDFLIVRVDRNSHRKNFGDTWKAVVPIMQRHKDVHLWMHCRAEGDQLELPQVWSRDMSIADRIHVPGNLNTKRGWSDADLLTVYAAADVFVSTSWGEGFGLTLAEAAACEVPIVAQNVSAIPEVVGPGGILIEPQRLITVDSGHDQWLPDVDAFTDAIEKLYGNRRLRRELGEAGRAHVSQLTWDEAARRFNDVIVKTISGGSNAGGNRAAVATAHAGS